MTNTNFKDALRKGMDAHERARIARREIEEVLAAASADLTSFLNSKVDLQIEFVDRPTHAAQRMGAAEPREKALMLVAMNRQGKRESLADVQFAEVGFPVSLRWGNAYQQASNRDEFERVISSLFESASTGEKLIRLVGQAA
jgi:hypothetical protein